MTNEIFVYHGSFTAAKNLEYRTGGRGQGGRKSGRKSVVEIGGEKLEEGGAIVMTSEVNARERRTLVVVLAFRIGFLVDWFVWLAVVSVYFAVFAKLSSLSLFRSFFAVFFWRRLVVSARTGHCRWTWSGRWYESCFISFCVLIPPSIPPPLPPPRFPISSAFPMIRVELDGRRTRPWF